MTTFKKTFALIAFLFLPAMAQADSCYDTAGTGDFSCEGGPSNAAPKKPVSQRSPREIMRDNLKKAQEARAAQEARRERVLAAQTQVEGIKARLGETITPADRADVRRDYEAARTEYRVAADAFISNAPASERSARRSKRDEVLADLLSTARNAGLFDLSPAPRTVAAGAEPSWPRKVLCEPKDRKGVERCYEVGERGLSCRMVLEKNGDRMWSENQPRCSNALALELRNELIRGNEQPVVARTQPASSSNESSVDVSDALDNGIAVVGALGGLLGGASALANASRGAGNIGAAASATSGVSSVRPTAPRTNASTITGRGQ